MYTALAPSILTHFRSSNYPSFSWLLECSLLFAVSLDLTKIKVAFKVGRRVSELVVHPLLLGFPSHSPISFCPTVGVIAAFTLLTSF